jgi:transcription initiation factor IIE alpha subunit
LETGGFIYEERAYAEVAMTASEEFTFVCPDCGETMEVNDSMRAALLENGCVICSASVSDAAFAASEESPEQ